MIINSKKLSALVEAVGNGHNQAFDFSHLKIDKETGMQASDGHSLYWTGYPELEPEYPEMNEAPYSVDLPVFIPATAIKKAINNVPKKCSLAILSENIAITSLVETGKTILTTTDLDTTDNVITKREEDRCFPHLEEVIKQEREEKVVNLSLDQLEQLVKVAKKLGQTAKALDTIRIGIIDSDSPVSVRIEKDGQTINGLIMPCNA